MVGRLLTPVCPVRTAGLVLTNGRRRMSSHAHLIRIATSFIYGYFLSVIPTIDCDVPIVTICHCM